MMGLANQINSELDNVEKLILKIFSVNYKAICLSDDEWQNCIKEFKNNKEKFKFLEEKNTVEINKVKTLKEKAKELFE